MPTRIPSRRRMSRHTTCDFAPRISGRTARTRRSCMSRYSRATSSLPDTIPMPQPWRERGLLTPDLRDQMLQLAANGAARLGDLEGAEPARVVAAIHQRVGAGPPPPGADPREVAPAARLPP